MRDLAVREPEEVQKIDRIGDGRMEAIAHAVMAWFNVDGTRR